MKKIMGLLLLTGIVFLSACGQQTDSAAGDDGKINVVATTTMIKDLVEQVGGEQVAVTGLMGPGVDPHTYKPSATEVNTIGEADMIAYNGLHLEAQFTDVFEQSAQRGIPTMIIGDAISEDDLIQAEGGTESTVDPHIWFSVENWKLATDYVAEHLSEQDPDHTVIFEENAEAYKQELDELQTYITERIEEIPEQSRYLVTAHDAFSYFGEAFDFEVVGLQGINTQTEAGTGDISSLADFIVEKAIRSVFVESSVSSRNMDALIEAVNSRGQELQNAGELFSDALGDEAQNAETYIKMYRSNIDTIVEGLN